MIRTIRLGQKGRKIKKRVPWTKGFITAGKIWKNMLFIWATVTGQDMMVGVDTERDLRTNEEEYADAASRLDGSFNSCQTWSHNFIYLKQKKNEKVIMILTLVLCNIISYRVFTPHLRIHQSWKIFRDNTFCLCFIRHVYLSRRISTSHPHRTKAESTSYQDFAMNILHSHFLPRQYSSPNSCFSDDLKCHNS